MDLERKGEIWKRDLVMSIPAMTELGGGLAVPSGAGRVPGADHASNCPGARSLIGLQLLTQRIK